MNLLLALTIVIAPFATISYYLYFKYRCAHDWIVIVNGKWETVLKCNKCGKIHKEFVIR